MYLNRIRIINHEFLKNIDIDLINPNTNSPYSIVVFVGENGCGKTSLLTEISKMDKHHYLFLRQNSMYIGFANETYKVICGKELYPTQNNEKEEANEDIYNKSAFLELLKSLNDESLLEVYQSGKFDHSRFGGEATRIIDGKEGFFDFNVLSSGQQEILAKLKILKYEQSDTDIVLLDEPETSLHPRWQKRIVYLIRELINNSNGVTPQLFVATHSEKILESIIHHPDALVIRLYKANGEIKHQKINEMDLRLPMATFAELDYVIFQIDSFIRENDCYNESIHYKEWFNERFNDVTSRNIATYCRNYYHHPKNKEVPSEKELHDAIELLRNVVLNLK